MPRAVTIITRLSAAVALIATAYALWTAHWLEACLGGFLVGGAFGAASVLRRFSAIDARMSEMARQLDDDRRRLDLLEWSLKADFSQDPNEPQGQTLDPPSVSPVDPSPLVAATLDGNAFPRLATLAETGGAVDGPSLQTNTPPVDQPDDTERSLRQSFSEAARRRDYPGLLTIGERMCTVFPNSPIAENFKRIRPLLLRRFHALQELEHSAKLRALSE